MDKIFTDEEGRRFRLVNHTYCSLKKDLLLVIAPDPAPARSESAIMGEIWKAVHDSARGSFTYAQECSLSLIANAIVSAARELARLDREAK